MLQDNEIHIILCRRIRGRYDIRLLCWASSITWIAERSLSLSLSFCPRWNPENRTTDHCAFASTISTMLIIYGTSPRYRIVLHWMLKTFRKYNKSFNNFSSIFYALLFRHLHITDIHSFYFSLVLLHVVHKCSSLTFRNGSHGRLFYDQNRVVLFFSLSAIIYVRCKRCWVYAGSICWNRLQWKFVLKPHT